MPTEGQGRAEIGGSRAGGTVRKYWQITKGWQEIKSRQEEYSREGNSRGKGGGRGGRRPPGPTGAAEGAAPSLLRLVPPPRIPPPQSTKKVA